MSAVLKQQNQYEPFGTRTYDLPDNAHLDWLESEAIHIMREVVAETKNPALLFSGGKDSIVMLRLAEKAFRPDRFPFPLLHIDSRKLGVPMPDSELIAQDLGFLRYGSGRNLEELCDLG